MTDCIRQGSALVWRHIRMVAQKKELTLFWNVSEDHPDSSQLSSKQWLFNSWIIVSTLKYTLRTRPKCIAIVEYSNVLQFISTQLLHSFLLYWSSFVGGQRNKSYWMSCIPFFSIQNHGFLFSHKFWIGCEEMSLLTWLALAVVKQPTKVRVWDSTECLTGCVCEKCVCRGGGGGLCV